MRKHGDLNNDLPTSPKRERTRRTGTDPCSGDSRPLLNLSKLPAELRRPVWEQLQQARPELAAWVEDESVQALKRIFDADVIVEDFRGDTKQE